MFFDVLGQIADRRRQTSAAEFNVAALLPSDDTRPQPINKYVVCCLAYRTLPVRNC